MHPKYRIFPPCFKPALAALWLLQSAVAEDLSLWKGSRSIYLNTTAGGANVRADVTGFPVLIRLDRGNFDFTQAMGRGEDIRFSKRQEALILPHEIERWDSAAGKAEIWVRLDTVKGDAKDQSFTLHWGRPGAADASDAGAVFDSAGGFTAVWHLGGAGSRPNSVPGGNSAVPNAYQGGESTSGLIGLADSLPGGAVGKFLDLGDGYSDFQAGFTYSIWAKPDAPLSFAKLLDLGNGSARDNITFYRVDTTNDLGFRIYDQTDPSARIVAPSACDTKAWRMFAVSVSGRVVKLFRDGDLIKEDTLAFPIPKVRRTLNYLGASNWANNAYYRGLLDEPVLAHVARSPDWIRLCHANQRPAQTLVSFDPGAGCSASFSVPADTAVPERGSLVLSARADCATAYAWSFVSGPAFRILDPEVKELLVSAPRVSGDSALLLRFTAVFPWGESSKQVRVTVRESVPDPVFALPQGIEWSTGEDLPIVPSISNLAALQAGPAADLAYRWSLEGIPVDTHWVDGGLLLRRPQGAGRIRIGLCLDNGGAASCDSTWITAKPAATGMRAQARFPGGEPGAALPRDARGRSIGAGRAGAGARVAGTGIQSVTWHGGKP